MSRPESPKKSLLAEEGFRIGPFEGKDSLGVGLFGIDDSAETVEPQVSAENNAAVRRGEPTEGVSVCKEGVSPLLEPAHRFLAAR